VNNDLNEQFLYVTAEVLI